MKFGAHRTSHIPSISHLTSKPTHLCRIKQEINDFRLLVAIPSLYNPANYGRFSVCFLSPGLYGNPMVLRLETSLSPLQMTILVRN